jgi:hypothetical protein
VVPRVLARQRVGLGALALADAVVVAAVAAAHKPAAGALVVALLLAPVAVGATATIAARIGGDRFAVWSAALLVLLPLLGNRYMLSTYRGTFDSRALPSLVGTRHTGVFALGVGIAVIVGLAPRLAAAAGGATALVVAAAIWQFDGVGALGPGLHETVWSITLLEWLVVAGILGVALRSPLLAAAVGGWLLAGLLWAAHEGYHGAVFWRSLALAAPAAAVLLSSLALLVPRLQPARPRAAAPTER